MADGSPALTSEQERLVREGLPILELVGRRVERRLGGGVPLDDLLAIGRFALMDIVRSFDPSRARFPPYCAMKLKWAIIDGVRRETHGRSIAARARAIAGSERFGKAEASEPMHEGAEPTMEGHQSRLGALLAGHAAALVTGLVAGTDGDELLDPSDTPEERVSRDQLRRELGRAIEALPVRERALIERHYYGGERFDLISEELGISKSRGSRIHAQALVLLSKALTRDFVEE